MRRIVCACMAVLAWQAPALADPVADFYRGKTISLYVGFPPGGGYDLYARVFAPHFTRHIPGNPPIVLKTMLGGSGIRAASYMTAVTPQDGTSLGLFLDIDGMRRDAPDRLQRFLDAEREALDREHVAPCAVYAVFRKRAGTAGGPPAGTSPVR